MRIDELTRPSREVAVQRLKSAGYSFIGAGQAASVFSKPGSNTVIKLLSSNDHAHFDFLKLCKETSNPHFPKIFGNPIKVTGDYYAIKMEMLTPLDKSIAPLIAEAIYAGWSVRREGKNTSTMKAAMDFQFPRISKDQPELIEAIDLMNSKLNGYFVDLHSENVMRRGSTVVIVDPVIS